MTKAGLSIFQIFLLQFMNLEPFGGYLTYVLIVHWLKISTSECVVMIKATAVIDWTQQEDGQKLCPKKFPW